MSMVTENETLDITILLDRSGSMMSIKDDMEGGFAELMKEQDDNAQITLCQFDTEYEEVYRDRSPRDAKLNLEPRGATALLDSMMRCIADTEARLKDYLGKRIFVVITDGCENSSIETNTETLKKRVEALPNWNFVYLGANQDSFAQAGMFGFKKANIMNYAANTAGTKQAYRGIASAVSDVKSGGTGNVGGSP